jgi:aminopeptidase N
VRFKTSSGTVSRTLDIRELTEDFHIALPAAPQQVRVDPDYTVLAKVRLDLPTDLLYAQLEDPDDMLGRLLALAGQTGQETIARLQRRLNEDPFHGVRIEASKALRAAHTDPALEALLAAADQPDPRVRQQVYSDLSAFYRASVGTTALAAAERERNPDLRAAAILSLAPYGSAATRSALLRSLATDSFRNVVADAAIEAMRGQDDPAFLPPLLAALVDRGSAFTSHGFARALNALAWLARNDSSRDRVREFLVAQLDDPRPVVRRAAIEALGTLGDPKALAPLETFTRAPRNSPEHRTAATAVSALRAGRQPSAELSDLHREVVTLQQENRELRSDLEELRKKFEAVHLPKAP